MKNIQPFIDLGFYTVPLKGKLEREEDGSKTIPIFEKNWRSKYQKEFNEIATELGGAITGAISDFIAIDCDDQKTYDLFRALDSDNDFLFISKGKPKGGGTIIYKYPTGTTLESFSIQNELLHMDFYSDNGFVYLPSDRNTTKEAWVSIESYRDMPALRDIPTTVLTLLYNLQRQYTLAKNPVAKKAEIAQEYKRANYLAPQLELLLAKKKFIPSLFRIITPKDFRDLEEYKRLGYLHPNNVPEGRGSEYLSKVSAILGADPSINVELYEASMHFINNLWDDPIPRNRLEKTVLEPMISGKASIGDIPIWRYDEHWQSRGMAFTTKLGDACEVFFDHNKGSYYFLNHTKEKIQAFHKENTLFEYIEPVGNNLPTRKEIKQMVPLVETSIDPTQPYGFYDIDGYNRGFNLFNQTPALAILNDPKAYEEFYTRPETTIKFFDSFIPDIYMRNYLLGFIKRKLTTFDYSPVVLYFLGAHGSGKDTFVAILEGILGGYISKPTTKEFLEHYNSWMLDTYFVQLDEYGNQLASLHDKQEALGKIKAYSGKSSIQIRQMRTDGFTYNHKATFIMTQNSNPLMLEDGDRRVAIFETPKSLANEEWVLEAGGIAGVITKIHEEINDFCYYLATERDIITSDEYVQAPNTDMKRDIIAEKLPAAQRVAYYLRHSMWEQLEELTEEANTPEVLEHAINARIYEEDMFNLYTYMTEGRGSKRGLTKVMRDNDFEKVPTTKEGVKSYYYHIPTLMYYKPSQPFKEEVDVQVEGV